MVADENRGPAFHVVHSGPGNLSLEANGQTINYTLSANRLSSWGTNAENTISYNTAGCVTEISLGGTNTRTLAWDSRYRLTSVATNGTTAETYGYDSLGRRVSISDGATTTYLVYDGIHCIADTDASGNLLRSYNYGPGLDNILSMTVYGATTQTYYYVKDHLGSVQAVVDSFGSVIESYKYDAWGNTTVFDGSGNQIAQSAIGNRYCWQGREISWKTGLYYFRARWYEPVTGRWLSNDPLGITGGLNQYVFCGDNGVNETDPLGMDAYLLIDPYGGPTGVEDAGHVDVGVDIQNGKILTRSASWGQITAMVTYDNLKKASANGQKIIIRFPKTLPKDNDKCPEEGKTSDQSIEDFIRSGKTDCSYLLYCSTYSAESLGHGGFDVGMGLTPNMLMKKAKKVGKEFRIPVP